jgi:lysophospholipase L1-like esterase
VAFDAVVDFDMAVRDPNNPLSFLPAYDSGDHLHPNNAGYQAMADAIDLSIFQPSSAPPVVPDSRRSRR